MKKLTLTLLAMCSLLLLAGDYNEERLINDFGKLFKLETVDYEGNKMMLVAVNEGSASEYGNLLKHFNQYLSMINQLAGTYKIVDSLKNLASTEAEAALLTRLRADPFLKKELPPLMARYLQANGHSVSMAMEPRPTYDLKAVMPVAARFFYPHIVRDKFAIHICVGINGLHALNPEPPAALAAFSFQAIWSGRSEIPEFISHIKKSRKEKEDLDILAFQKEIWEWLENNHRLKSLLIEEYELRKDILPFILDTGKSSDE
ncbi:MAG: hypothetical protein KJ808_01350 [Acidobacteria bacterium]|nr:hypothetical protein [Acidobacteriota bacterium]MBU4307333.1 hypothetical protein [Acidobacteriota bacterium]MBU4405615.1 hypothetical protein [Acidobacteriota bacterium]MCG2811093.1 hypothetical protein [Candidatus Aminicenantes bacterium]